MTLTPNEARARAADMWPAFRKETERLDRIDRWWRWSHDKPHQPRQATREYRELVARAETPWLGLVVNAVVQGLYVEGYRRASDPDNAAPWAVWQENGMDSRQVALHRAAIGYGLAYATVLPGVADTGEAVPVIRGVSPRRMLAVYDDPAEDDWPVFALRADPVRVSGAPGWRLRLYDDSDVHELVAGRDGSSFSFVGSEAHDVGVCPVVRYANMIDLEGRSVGEVEPFISIAGRIDQTTFDRLVVQRFASWVVRTVAGMSVSETTAQTGESAEQVKLRLKVEDLLVAEDADTKFGSLPASPLDGFIAAKDADIHDLAAVSQTAPHHLLGTMVNLPLALDTPVPVPGGRSTMGDLRVGDEVWAPDGTAVPVTALSPIWLGRDCYRLRFDDGAEIVADAEHRWRTSRFRSLVSPYQHGRVVGLVTTEEIAGSLRTASGGHNHFIPVAAAPDGPEQPFPVDPYVLGVWLGNGDRINGAITHHKDDADEIAALLADCGETVRVRPYPPGDEAHRNCRIISIAHDFSRCPYGHVRARGTHDDAARCVACAALRYRFKAHGEPMPARINESFQARLTGLGVRGDKHIPEGYFHGSFKQRLALLQGVMDTDGSVNRKQGSLTITLHDERLARDVQRLVMSLGQKAVLRCRRWSNDLGAGWCWRMSWSALDPVFRLRRKAILQRTDFGGGDGRSNSPLRRYIVACDPVGTVPVRCITVGSAAHLFCVTDAFITSPNSAEALAAAEANATRKKIERQHSLGESHEQTLRLAASIMGDTAGARDMSAQVVWRDMESRSLAQAADALGKLATMLGVPVEMLWEKIPGWTQQDVERAKDKAAQAGGMDALLAQLAGGTPAGGNGAGPVPPSPMPPMPVGG